MIINEKYINKIFFSQAVVDVEGFNKSFTDTDGLFRATMNVRNSETKKEEGFYGQIPLSNKDNTKKRELEQDGKYEIQHSLTLAWE